MKVKERFPRALSKKTDWIGEGDKKRLVSLLTKEAALFFFRIGGELIRQFQNIIRGGMIKPRKANQQIQRKLTLSVFVLRIGVLAHMEIIRLRLLRQIVIFA